MIPVYINTFNRLTTTEKLCRQVSQLTDCVPIIVDNDSSWQPLLDWYKNCPYEVIRLDHNMGHHAPWLSGAVQSRDTDFYIVTDCDIDIEGVPADAAQLLRVPFNWKDPAQEPFRSDNWVIKSGLSLRIDDLPEWQRASVNRIERNYWVNPVAFDTRFYWAWIDTTFAMYHKSTWHMRAMRVRVPSVRAVGKYQARHYPWYLDCNNLGEEDANYFLTASKSNSWIPSGQGLRARWDK